MLVWVQFLLVHFSWALRLQGFESDEFTVLENDVCGNMHGIEKEFCFSVLGTQSKANMAEYKTSRKECDWVTRGNFKSQVSVPGTAVTFASSDRKYQNYNNTYAKSCNKLLEGGDTLRIFRVGPFVSDGNDDKWYRFGMEDLMPDLNGKEVGLRGYLQAATDANGDLLGYPPLQLHHHHFTDLQCDVLGFFHDFKSHFQTDDELLRLFRIPMGWPVWADTHADKQCSEAMGGTDCLIRLWPQNFALPMKLQRSACFFGDYVDVREPNSPRITWWVEAMMRITLHMQQFLGMGGLTHSQWYDLPSLNMSFPNAEYIVDIRNETVVWSSFKFPFSGRVALVLKHSHRFMLEDMFLVRGPPDTLGLPGMQYLDHTNFLQRNIAPDLIQHEQHILERIQQLQNVSLAELVCREQDQKNSLERVNGISIDRMLPVPCVGWKFYENETFTLITFHKAQEGFSLPRRNLIAMHSAFTIYGIPDGLPVDPFDTLVNGEGVSIENLPHSRLFRKWEHVKTPYN